MIEENETEVHNEVGEIKIETKNKGVIHRHMNVNEYGKKLHILEEVLDEYPDDTSSVVMEDCVNEELDYCKNNEFIQKNDT